VLNIKRATMYGILIFAFQIYLLFILIEKK
jgi:hypothetical protein